MNIVGYVENCRESFLQRPFSEVDSLVLSQLSYIRFDGLAKGLKEGGEPVLLRQLFTEANAGKMLSGVRDGESNAALLSALVISPRFGELSINYYESELSVKLEEQFSAMTFFLPNTAPYIAFRGTDATIIGWKEDFNMAFQSPVPSQQRALDYLLRVAEQIDGNFMQGGHSKGGNLAVYSGFSAPESVQQRILAIYDHDGPGFKEKLADNEGFVRIERKILKTVPESSVIGMLLECGDSYRVVESSRIWINQHDPFSWKIAEWKFCLKENVSGSAVYTDRTLTDWLSGLSDPERERFVDILFGILGAGGAETFAQLREGWQKNVPAMLSAVHGTNPEMRRFEFRTLAALGGIMLRNLRSLRGLGGE